MFLKEDFRLFRYNTRKYLRMEEKELHFTKKKRHHVAPNCPCGEVNSPKNPFFSPFEDCEGQYGHCHKCDKTFMPDSEPQKGIIYKAPEKKPQQFISPEPVFDWLFPDTTITPKPEGQIEEGDYTITWYYRDIKGRLTSAKEMEYRIDDQGFRRIKERHPRYPYMRDSGYYGCLFYERDLITYPQAKVILLESEKSAALLRRKFKDYLQEFIYLAVGGANGLTNEKLPVLKNREVLIIYDCDNGERQEDGSIKSPKGREAAEAAAIKLSPICRTLVIDLFPDRNDGTDLGDIYKTIDIDFIRKLHGKEVVDDNLIQHLKSLNRKDIFLNNKDIQSLAGEYTIHPDKIRQIEFQVKKNYESERGVDSGPLIQRIELWLNERYEFRRDIHANKIYYKKKEDTSWAPCNDSDLWREILYDTAFFGEKRIQKYEIETILKTKFVPDYTFNNEEWEEVNANNSEEKIKLLWEQTLIVSKPDVPPPLILIDETPICAPGDHTLLIGKKKSRKSLLVTHLISKYLQRRDTLADDVLVFDTEQGKSHVWQARDRVYRMTNQYIPVFYLRGRSPRDRMHFIEMTVKHWHRRPKILVIDGIRDLMSNINDPDESTELIVWLEKLTLHHQVAIINILHINKTDNNARGHIGTELLNKAICTIEVVYDDKTTYSAVKCESSREKPFDMFMFTHGATGLPELMGTPSGEDVVNQDDKIQRLKAVFEGEMLKNKELRREIGAHFGVGDYTSRKLLADFIRRGWIIKSGPDRNPNTVYKMASHPVINTVNTVNTPIPEQAKLDEELPF